MKKLFLLLTFFCFNLSVFADMNNVKGLSPEGRLLCEPGLEEKLIDDFVKLQLARELAFLVQDFQDIYDKFDLIQLWEHEDLILEIFDDDILTDREKENIGIYKKFVETSDFFITFLRSETNYDEIAIEEFVRNDIEVCIQEEERRAAEEKRKEEERRVAEEKRKEERKIKAEENYCNQNDLDCLTKLVTKQYKEMQTCNGPWPGVTSEAADWLLLQCLQEQPRNFNGCYKFKLDSWKDFILEIAKLRQQGYYCK